MESQKSRKSRFETWKIWKSETQKVGNLINCKVRKPDHWKVWNLENQKVRNPKSQKVSTLLILGKLEIWFAANPLCWNPRQLESQKPIKIRKREPQKITKLEFWKVRNPENCFGQCIPITCRECWYFPYQADLRCFQEWCICDFGWCSKVFWVVTVNQSWNGQNRHVAPDWKHVIQTGKSETWKTRKSETQKIGKLEETWKIRNEHTRLLEIW